MNSRVRLVFAALAAGLFVIAACTAPALAISMEESRRGLYGRVVDDQGQPVVGVTIAISPRPDMGDAMKLKTSERGFTFPRLAEQPAEYYLRVESDEWYIRDYHIKSRRQSGELFQDDEGHLVPGAGDRLPPIKWRVANSTVELVLAKIADFKAMKEAAAKQTQVTQQVSMDQQIQELVAVGDYSGAAAKLAKLLEETPADADRRWQRAVLLARAGETQNAIREAQKAIAIKPDMKGVRPALASWLNEYGESEAAIAALEKERELDPQNPVVYKGLAGLYESTDRKADAEQAVSKWAELAPDDTEALMALARARAERGDFAGAEEMYRKIAEKDPSSAYQAFFNAGAAIWNRKGDINAAIAAFRKSIELKPDYPKSHLLLGYCLLNQGSMGEARASFEKFVELAPNDPEAAEIKKLAAGLPKK